MAPELLVLDVAHGNSTLVIGEETTVLVDAPRGGLHIDALKAKSIQEVHAVLISHADADHVGGVSNLLYEEDIRVHRVYVNADASKTAEGGGDVWRNFVTALADAEQRAEVKVFAFKRGDTIRVNDENIRLDVLAPAVDLALLGVGGRLDGQRIRSNTLSGVVRVLFEGQPIALLTGDLDSLGLEKLFESNDDLRTRVLVFPHHGGHCGGDDREFASAITTAVNPEIVVFSFGRTQHGNPRPEIVAGIRSARPGVHIMCTQLSMRCSTPARFPPYVGRLPAKGKHVGHCCAGSIRFDVEGLDAPSAADHAAFVDDLGPAPLCRLPLRSSQLDIQELARRQGDVQTGANSGSPR